MTYPVLTAKDLLAYQLNGAIAQTLMNGMLTLFQSHDNDIEYWLAYSIDTAEDTELDKLGVLLGIPRPTYSGSTWFRFGTKDKYPEVSDEGLSSVANNRLGGMFWSTRGVYDVVIYKLTDAEYRLYIKACLKLKQYHSLDALLTVVSVITKNKGCTLSFDGNHDIQIECVSAVDIATVDLIQIVADTYFTTSPLVKITRAA